MKNYLVKYYTIYGLFSEKVVQKCDMLGNKYFFYYGSINDMLIVWSTNNYFQDIKKELTHTLLCKGSLNVIDCFGQHENEIMVVTFTQNQSFDIYAMTYTHYYSIYIRLRHCLSP